MLPGVFESLAEYERSLIAERSAAAREAARARGRPADASSCFVPGYLVALL